MVNLKVIKLVLFLELHESWCYFWCCQCFLSQNWVDLFYHDAIKLVLHEIWYNSWWCWCFSKLGAFFYHGAIKSGNLCYL